MRKFVAHPTTAVKAFTNPWDMNAEDVSTNNDDVIEWFDDASASVMDADWTADGEIIVSLDHNVQDIETTAAELISCIEPNGYHVSDWNVNGRNVFIFEVISNDEYAQLAADYSYIPEDDIYLSTAIKANSYDASKIQKYINSYGFNNYVVYDRDENWCAIDFEGKDEDDVIPLVNRIKAIIPETSIFEHYIEMYVGSATAIKAGYDDDQMVRCPYCTQLTSREIVRKYGMCWDCYDNNVE